jgi:hypothetical protein
LKPTFAITKSPSHSPTSVCVQRYGQCGGSGFPSQNCCSGDDLCTVVNDFYSQCTPRVTSAPVPSSDCVSTFGQCGGSGYSGPTSCCDASVPCVPSSEWYSQCVPPSG